MAACVERLPEHHGLVTAYHGGSLGPPPPPYGGRRGRDREAPERASVGLTRAEAAEALGMSLDSFERWVQPEVRLVRRGKLRLIPTAELQREGDRRHDQGCDQSSGGAGDRAALAVVG